MPWSRLTLPVKDQVVEFIAWWCHLFYKIIQYRLNVCVQNDTNNKNHAIGLCILHIVAPFFAHPVHLNRAINRSKSDITEPVIVFFLYHNIL